MTHCSVILQVDENVSHRQTPLESSQPNQLISSDPPEGALLNVQEFSAALTMAFPLRSHPAIDDPVPSAQSEVDLSSSQRLSSPVQTSRAFPVISVISHTTTNIYTEVSLSPT
ncbi:translin-associated factor X-interacting protein 1 [Thalassophryne amazonica]|uniref:translin-associated factor X-interacting protein 1 n=1 Tax=Thalassophryne amazonica TaxID=390379 RepID=UPI0014725128|nr:translin-associated factor X-interacting protein 1 [Thalassophryne amazonica]